MSDIQLIRGDCLGVLRGMDSGSADAVVTDPPSGIAFMSRNWDTFKWRSTFIDFLAPRLAECLRVAKPGARMLCWALPRTSHWTATAVEDAGWLIEDRVVHLFGQGFPKAKSKLKPAVEDWWLARKPGGKVPDLNVDACRIEGVPPSVPQPSFNSLTGKVYGMKTGEGRNGEMSHAAGRWPATLCLSHHPACRQVGTKRVKGTNPIGPNPGKLGYGGSDKSVATRHYAGLDGLETVAAWECHAQCPVAELDRQSGTSSPKPERVGRRGGCGFGLFDDAKSASATGRWPADPGGGASRFFATFGYFPKASRRDRGEGNLHPTVKSQLLMRWLIRLICKPGDMLIDPFAGSGSTLLAALAEGVDAIGIEDDSEPGSFATAERRLAAARLPLGFG